MFKSKLLPANVLSLSFYHNDTFPVLDCFQQVCDHVLLQDSLDKRPVINFFKLVSSVEKTFAELEKNESLEACRTRESLVFRLLIRLVDIERMYDI